MSVTWRMLALSALDLSPVSSGRSARDALLATVDLARHAESLGLARYWVAEHHNAKGLACSAPDVIIGQIAGATKTLRVGSGGVMLPNHAPLRVAETFRTLEGFFPGRIDLGLGRAAGTDPRTARLLRRAKDPRAMASPDDFPDELAALLALLDEHDPPRAPFAASVVAIPAVDTSPTVFVLGSSEFGGALAAKMGLGFAFAHQINPADAIKVMRAYKRDFVPSTRWPSPYGILSVSALAAETPAAAADALQCVKLATLRFAQGARDLPAPSLAEARAHVFDADENALVEAFARGRHIGTAPEVCDELRALARAADADEVMVMSASADHAARKRSYTLLADAWS
jgi:luciferase family oxidoreductase group 1